VRTLHFLLPFLIIANLTVAQERDTTFERLDEVITSGDSISSDYAEEDDVIYNAPPDSLVIKKRSFTEEEIGRLKSDPDMAYKQPPTVAESLWDRFWAWIAEFFDSLFDKAVNTNWGKVIVYALGLALLIVVIMLILKVNAFRVLYSGEGNAQKYHVLDENIHEMDFDNLIREATDRQDYRRGVRLLFLYALKLLSDKDLIHWESGKTNHDYVDELNKGDLKGGFNELSMYFDYAWYGNFNISHDTFNKAQGTFTNWKNKLS
jgi:hypothetical protein